MNRISFIGRSRQPRAPEPPPNRAPTITLGVVPQGIVEGQAIIVQFTITDDQGVVVSSITATLGGVQADTITETSAMWSAAPSEGTHALSISYTDEGGLSASALDSVTTVAANTAPVVVLGTLPSNIVEGAQVVVPFTITDDKAIITANIVATLGSSAATSVTATSATWSAAPAAGSYPITISYTDAEGLSHEDSDVLVVVPFVDTEPPEDPSALSAKVVAAYSISLTWTNGADDQPGAYPIISWSEVLDTTPPSAPSGLAASGVVQDSITITWTNGTDGEGEAIPVISWAP